MQKSFLYKKYDVARCRQVWCCVVSYTASILPLIARVDITASFNIHQVYAKVSALRRIKHFKK